MLRPAALTEVTLSPTPLPPPTLRTAVRREPTSWNTSYERHRAPTTRHSEASPIQQVPSGVAARSPQWSANGS